MNLNLISGGGARRFLSLAGCVRVTDAAMMPFLTARGHSLSGLTLRHMSRCTGLTFLPFSGMYQWWQVGRWVGIAESNQS